jgi:hypothetical protein
MADTLSDMDNPASRRAILTTLLTLQMTRVLAILADQGLQPADLPAEEPAVREILCALVQRSEDAVAALRVAAPQQLQVAPFYDVDRGQPLPDAVVNDWVAYLPTMEQPWNQTDRQQELRLYQFPANFMPHRREFGVPEISAGPWSGYVKSAGSTGQLVVKADKIAATMQKGIEDCFRPYWVAVQQLQAAHEANEAPEAGTLDDLLLLGKCLANASVFCEQNRVKTALAILKPGSEDLFGQQLKQPLLNTQAVAALQAMRDTAKARHQVAGGGHTVSWPR